MTPLACPRQSPTPTLSPKTKGFSLIELLTVIMIIGLLAAVFVPVISGLNENSSDARHRRNAQNLASTYLAGETAGADFLVPGDLNDTIGKIVSGSVVENGVFAGQLFSVPGLDEFDRAAAAEYLELQGDRLTYKPNL